MSLAKNKVREVFIVENSHGTVWLVRYKDRRIGQRYCAGQFYKKDYPRSYVENWVNNNPKLKLTLTPEPPRNPIDPHS